MQLGENDEIPKGLNAEYVSIGGEASLVFKGKDGHVMTGSEVKKFMTDYKQDLYDRTAHGSGEYAGKSIKDITNEVISKIDYSKLSPNSMKAALKQDGVQLNYGGQKYTVHQGNFVDAQGNKYDVKDGKPVQKENDKAPLADVDFTNPEYVGLLDTFYHPNAQLNFGGTMYTVQQDKTLVDAQGNKFSVQNNKLVPVKTSQEPVQTYGKHGNLNVDNDSSGGPFIKSRILDFE